MQELLCSSGKLDSKFAAFVIKKMPLAVLLVDNEIRVQVINEAAQAFFRTSGEAAYLQSCGDVFKCINAHRVEGCGGCPACLKCTLWNSVLEALEGGNVSRNKGNFDVIREGEVKRLPLLLTTAPMLYETNRIVIVLIEDISLITHLQGLIPICSVCHRVRDHREEWISLEKYIITYSEAEFTHDYCPVCSDKMREQHALKKECAV